MGDKLREARNETARLERDARRLKEETEAAARLREQARMKAALVDRFKQEYPKMAPYLTGFTSPGYAQMIARIFPSYCRQATGVIPKARGCRFIECG